MLPSGKRAVILGARGDYGYDPGGRQADANFVEAGLKAPLAYIGLRDATSIAVEFDEFADERLARSIAAAESAVDALVDRLIGERSEEQTSELQSLMRISYAVFCLKRKNAQYRKTLTNNTR